MDELKRLLEDRGALAAGRLARWTPRHFGSPGGEYRAATEACGVAHRADRRLLRVHGRAPRRMLHGIVTNRIPEPPAELAEGAAAGGGRGGGAAGGDELLLAGEAVYGAILTPKGKMVTDSVTAWLGADEAKGLGLSVATSGREEALRHLSRLLPPRFARVHDMGAEAGLLTLVGPRAGTVAAKAFGAAPAEGCALLGGGPASGGLLVCRGVEQVPSWDVWAPSARLAGCWRMAEDAGAAPVGFAVWDTLRIEEGLPAFGVDMDATTIPVEAGLLDRAFDHDKGCYTGQEVIVRIRDRGRVNWRLRALRFGDSAPKAGDRLFEEGVAKARGRVTSVARSPRFGQTIGLGYVRREIEPPATLRLSDGSGPEVGVEEC